MKLSPDSPELTAYALGELPPDQRAAVEAAIAGSPELAAEVRLLAATADHLERAMAAEPQPALKPTQRAAILQSPTRQGGVRSPAPARTPASTTILRWWHGVRTRWLLASAGVALAAITLTLTFWTGGESPEVQFASLRYQERVPEKPGSVTRPPETAPAPAPPIAASDKVKVRTSLQTSQAAPVQVIPASPTPGPGQTRGAVAADAGPSLADLSASPDSNYGLQFPKEADSLSASGQIVEFRSAAGPDSSQQVAPVPQLATAASASVAAGRGLAAATPTALNWQPAAPDTDRGRSDSLQRLHLEPQPDRFVGESLVRRPSGFESYAPITDNPFKSPGTAPLSTFGLDVDTASYANVRRFLRDGSLPPADAVRLEELINYFRYDYPAPRGEHPLAATVEIAECPWREGHKLVRVGVQAAAVERAERPRANLVFLVDVSGSMEPENRLPLVKRSLRLLLDRLAEHDTVGIVTYAGESRIALEPTAATTSGRERILEVIEGLRAGGSTAGGAGIQSAYQLAGDHFIAGGVNRVLLCTDGDFNVGITDPDALQRLIEERARSGVFLSVLGYGMGNLKDSTMERLANRGNGNYAYVDSFAEARKVLGEQLEGTLVTVAKDVKVQVEFNPARVRSYRLLGYENRLLRDRDFNDDTKDAGEVGAGHQVTVLYEIEPAVPNLAGTDPLRYQGATEAAPDPAVRLRRGHEDELLLLKVRYQAPEGTRSRLIEQPVKDGFQEWARASADLRFAAAVAGYGMLLRQSPHRGDLTWDRVLRMAEEGLGADREGYRAEFVDLARRAQHLSRGR
ncbi:MAG: von Willebrand factor type A domain-containing protein [Verrucomicrobiae bacterium]|nr:von Willebrand factor type A domain-containing protein [Verrucomicrobiae bacterium]